MRSVVRTNGEQSITGSNMQGVLTSFINTIKEGCLFKGVATPLTEPDEYDANMFYLASENGLYANFGSVLLNNEVAILSNESGEWSKTTLFNKSTDPFNGNNADSFEVSDSGTATVDVSGDDDFIGSVPDGEPMDVELTLTGTSLSSVYRFVFDRDVNSVEVNNGQGATYASVSGPIRKGSVISFTALGTTTGSWAYSVNSTGVFSGDGSLSVSYLPDGSADIRWNPVEVNLSGKVTLRHDFSYANPAYSQSNVGKFFVAFEMPYNERAIVSISGLQMWSGVQNVLFISGGSNSGVVRSLFPSGFKFRHSGTDGVIQVCEHCPTSPYEPGYTRYVQILEYSGESRGDVSVPSSQTLYQEDALRDIDSVYRNPVSPSAYSFNIDHTGHGYVDMDGKTDFIGKPSEDLTNAEVTLDNYVSNTVYRFTFSKNIEEGVKFISSDDSETEPLLDITERVSAGDVLTITTVTGGWIYDLNRGLVASDGTLKQEIEDGTVKLGLYPDVLHNNTYAEGPIVSGSLSVGPGAYNYFRGIAIGESSTSHDLGVAIGLGAKAWNGDTPSDINDPDDPGFTDPGSSGIAIGYAAHCDGNGAVSVGAMSATPGNYCTAIGENAISSGSESVAIGHYAKCQANHVDEIAIGALAESDGERSIAIGAGAKYSGSTGIALGDRTSVNGSNNLAAGPSNEIHGMDSVLIGSHSDIGDPQLPGLRPYEVKPVKVKDADNNTVYALYHAPNETNMVLTIGGTEFTTAVPTRVRNSPAILFVLEGGASVPDPYKSVVDGLTGVDKNGQREFIYVPGMTSANTEIYHLSSQGTNYILAYFIVSSSAESTVSIINLSDSVILHTLRLYSGSSYSSGPEYSAGIGYGHSIMGSATFALGYNLNGGNDSRYDAQVIVGQNNIPEADSAFILGGGQADSYRANLLSVNTNGAVRATSYRAKKKDVQLDTSLSTLMINLSNALEHAQILRLLNPVGGTGYYFPTDKETALKVSLIPYKILAVQEVTFKLDGPDGSRAATFEPGILYTVIMIDGEWYVSN